jgi:geranylgeranyl pyrophosphate synthase
MDIRRGNLTIISIHALEHASRKDAEKLKNILQGKSRRVKDAIKIMEKSGSIDYARSKANYFASEAKKCLRVRLLRRSELTSLVDKVVHRCR